ncbi:hypothetical protein EGR_08347 [Echinococcus granulosus]|uniref:Uncharacterized protein n=1 Tax=Echinococcus granulosus TaxID=6210 RepID=W6UTM4_ECHGR|nr:hypothetical protein EGR_08347 [Echinococcus granulosus]EUB56769.1 hypothetical protein EGR_08347 [Echinococcus granulosus]
MYPWKAVSEYSETSRLHLAQKKDLVKHDVFLLCQICKTEIIKTSAIKRHCAIFDYPQGSGVGNAFLSKDDEVEDEKSQLIGTSWSEVTRVGQMCVRVSGGGGGRGVDADRLNEIGRSTDLPTCLFHRPPASTPPNLPTASQRVVAMPVLVRTCDHLGEVLNHPLRGLAPVVIAQCGGESELIRPGWTGLESGPPSLACVCVLPRPPTPPFLLSLFEPYEALW